MCALTDAVNVVEREAFKYEGQVIESEWHTPTRDMPERTTILVTGLSRGCDPLELVALLEDKKKSGGGDVERHEILSGGDSAIVKFINAAGKAEAVVPETL